MYLGHSDRLCCLMCRRCAIKTALFTYFRPVFRNAPAHLGGIGADVGGRGISQVTFLFIPATESMPIITEGVRNTDIVFRRIF
jgi:hypothetical protein